MYGWFRGLTISFENVQLGGCTKIPEMHDSCISGILDRENRAFIGKLDMSEVVVCIRKGEGGVCDASLVSRQACFRFSFARRLRKAAMAQSIPCGM